MSPDVSFSMRDLFFILVPVRLHHLLRQCLTCSQVRHCVAACIVSLSKSCAVSVNLELGVAVLKRHLSLDKGPVCTVCRSSLICVVFGTLYATLQQQYNCHVTTFGVVLPGNAHAANWSILACSILHSRRVFYFVTRRLVDHPLNLES